MFVRQENDPPLVLEPLRGKRALASLTSLLIVVNLVVAVSMTVIGMSRSPASNMLQLDWGANFAPATTDGEWWRLATAMFLHFGPFHLGMNMLALWDSGRLVERLYGGARYLAIYIGSGLTGNLLSLVMQGNEAVSAGASGAIFGVYGSFLAFLLVERRRLQASEFRLMFWGAAVFSAVALILGVLMPGIDNAAHFGGLATGGALGFVLSNPSKGSGFVRVYVRWLVAAIQIGAIALLVAYIPKPRYPWSEERQARGEIREFLWEDAKTNARLRALLYEREQAGASFEDLAGRIEAEVVHSYEESFEQLSALQISSAAPSAGTLEQLRRYAESRRDATQALAEGIREKNPRQVRDALDAVRRSGREVQGSLNKESPVR